MEDTRRQCSSDRKNLDQRWFEKTDTAHLLKNDRQFTARWTTCRTSSKSSWAEWRKRFILKSAVYTDECQFWKRRKCSCMTKVRVRPWCTCSCGWKTGKYSCQDQAAVQRSWVMRLQHDERERRPTRADEAGERSRRGKNWLSLPEQQAGGPLQILKVFPQSAKSQHPFWSHRFI